MKDNTVCDGQINDTALCKAEVPQDTIETASHIANKTNPPMVYLNKNVSYSPETVMANVSDLRKDVQNLKHLIAQ
jgi:hypothetical protein